MSPRRPLVATDRAALMLQLVPYLIGKGEVTVAEAADEFDVTPAEMQRMVEKLTGRESDMLQGICRGATDEEIAADLSVSLSTVRNHVASLYRKIGVNRRSAVVVWARERGIGTSGTSAGSKPKKLGRKH